MVAATVVSKPYQTQSVPGQETVVLKVSDGETYTAKTLATILAAQITIAEEDGATNAPTYTVDGNEITIHVASASDVDMAVTLIGY